MLKNNLVLRALKILTRDEVIKLSELLRSKLMSFGKQKDEGASPSLGSSSHENYNDHEDLDSSKILHLNSFEHEKNIPNPASKTQRKIFDEPNSESELFLFQLKISRHNEELTHKLNAFSEYKKNTELYSINKKEASGMNENKKRKFASTGGILINKKQA